MKVIDYRILATILVVTIFLGSNLSLSQAEYREPTPNFNDSILVGDELAVTLCTNSVIWPNETAQNSSNNLPYRFFLIDTKDSTETSIQIIPTLPNHLLGQSCAPFIEYLSDYDKYLLPVTYDYYPDGEGCGLDVLLINQDHIEIVAEIIVAESYFCLPPYPYEFQSGNSVALLQISGGNIILHSGERIETTNYSHSGVMTILFTPSANGTLEASIITIPRPDYSEQGIIISDIMALEFVGDKLYTVFATTDGSFRDNENRIVVANYHVNGTIQYNTSRIVEFDSNVFGADITHFDNNIYIIAPSTREEKNVKGVPIHLKSLEWSTFLAKTDVNLSNVEILNLEFPTDRQLNTIDMLDEDTIFISSNTIHENFTSESDGLLITLGKEGCFSLHQNIDFSILRIANIDGRKLESGEFVYLTEYELSGSDVIRQWNLPPTNLTATLVKEPKINSNGESSCTIVEQTRTPLGTIIFQLTVPILGVFVVSLISGRIIRTSISRVRK